jgi:hypothetical protein
MNVLCHLPFQQCIQLENKIEYFSNLYIPSAAPKPKSGIFVDELSDF